MHNRLKSSPETARQTPRLAPFAFVALTLSSLFGAWAAGCASGAPTTNTTSSNTSEGGHGGKATTTGSTTSGTAGSGGGAGGSGACAADEKTCDGACVKITDPKFGCSETGCAACAAPANAVSTCAGGICQLGDCDDGFKNCDGNDSNGCETNVASDPMQCGGCGSACVVPSATANCVNGMCGVGACNPGRVDCDGDPKNGCEAQLDFDPKNCGSCNHACPPGETCEMGICGLYCPKDKANCDSDEGNGCETALHTLSDCAFCGDACAPAHASATCDQNGTCILGQCDMGFSNCDTSSANGCETHTDGDANNCGNCGNVCPSGPHSTPVCQSGACKINCDPGYSDCPPKDPNDGCEIHSDVDVNNCGACGNVCNLPNATATCVAGGCIIAQCNAGFMDCDGNPANGCEINTQNNPSNCGACGMACQIANGSAACVAGMCAVGTCNMGYADCNGLVSDGCEANTANDTSNCGVCGKVCNLPNAAQMCTGGTCTIAACNPGFANCNNVQSDGCEINTTNSPLNCGACNAQCFVANGMAGCSNSQCTVAGCNNGFGDCNGLSQDGCETNLTNTLANCGTCGNNCTTSCQGNVTATTCNSGTCEVTGCAAGKFDVDGTCGNGCECQTAGTSSVCGSPSTLGALNLGQTTTYTGNLVPSGQEAYLAVTFNGTGNYSYHPHIRLTTGASEFAFDVLVNCQGGAIACGIEGGNSAGKSDWETYSSGGDPNDPGTYNPIPAVGNNGTVLIHVYRRAGKPVTCNNYTLTISN